MLPSIACDLNGSADSLTSQEHLCYGFTSDRASIQLKCQVSTEHLFCRNVSVNQNEEKPVFCFRYTAKACTKKGMKEEPEAFQRRFSKSL